MSGVCTGRVSKQRRSRRTKTRSVLRMMAIMQDRDNPEMPKEFLDTKRTGRRNALPDILQQQVAEITAAELAARLEQLGTSDAENPQPSTSQGTAPCHTTKNDDTKKES